MLFLSKFKIFNHIFIVNFPSLSNVHKTSCHRCIFLKADDKPLATPPKKLNFHIPTVHNHSNIVFCPLLTVDGFPPLIFPPFPHKKSFTQHGPIKNSLLLIRNAQNDKHLKRNEIKRLLASGKLFHLESKVCFI